MKKRLNVNPSATRLPVSRWLIVVIVFVLVSACTKNESQVADTYTCPMHPTVISDKQGVCPVCNMDLVRKARPGEEVKITEDLARLIKSPNETVVSSVKTVRGQFKSSGSSLQATGRVTYDTRQVYTLSARIGGRLEDVLVNYQFQPVRKGQRLATIYSPDLVEAQRELLYLLRHDSANELLIEGARQKLLLSGFSEAQLQELIQTQVLQYRFTINSPYEGYLITDTQPATSSAPVGASPMGMSAPTTQPAAPLAFLNEGDYVAAGQTLFTLVNRNSIRMEFNLTPAQSQTLTLGTRLQVRVGEMIQQAQVDFIQPFYSGEEKFVKIRAFVPGANLTIGTLVTAQWSASSQEALWLPREAVVDLGTRSVVFVKDRGAFAPKSVAIHSVHQDEVEVYGLSSTDEVAFHAQFLVDSEGFIKNIK